MTLFKCQPIQDCFLPLQEFLSQLGSEPDLQDKSEDKSVPEQPCVNPIGARLEKELLEWKAARLMPEGPSEYVFNSTDCNEATRNSMSVFFMVQVNQSL